MLHRVPYNEGEMIKEEVFDLKNMFKFIVICLTCFALIACERINFIREYTGSKIVKITCISQDYMGEYREINELNFVENKYLYIGYSPEYEEQPELEVKATFTENQEKAFMDECYTNGLFDLKERYESPGDVCDGGCWDFIIEYEDGTTKTSFGDNAGPYDVFNKCATTFYDLCGYPIVGILPDYYVTPPRLSYSFGNGKVYTNDFAKVTLANYKWNKGASVDNNIYQINEEIKEQNEFYEDVSYVLTLSTANYDCEEKFNKITVKEYDYNNELTNEKTIYSGKWFYHIKLDIQVNKIYVYELTFKDGDYAQYTFSTYCNNEKK